MMNSAYALNTTFGSCIIIVLIFIDYLHKNSTDRVQRKIFCAILGFSFFSALFSMLYSIILKMPGHFLILLTYAFDDAHFILQMMAYSYIFIFVDYIIFKEPRRMRRITVIVWIILSITILGFVTIFLTALFSNNPNQTFWTKNEYYLKSAICYVPMLFMLCDFFSSHGTEKKKRMNMVLLFAGMTFIGLVLDTVFYTAKLIWPCLSAVLFYAYLLIIKTDIQTDSFTGIGNRYSFNEFIDKLSRVNNNESYAIVMIDMDHLKHINDTLGHQEGDNALKDIAAIIKKCMRSSDFAARYGGDEFVLATNAKNEIEKLMGRIQQAIDVQNEKRIRPFKLQISYGYDIYSADKNQTIEEFLAYIDQLMYKDKERRRRADDAATGAAL